MPLLRDFDYDSTDDFFIKNLQNACERSPEPAFASLGAGNCDLEIRLARELLARGRRGFTISCIELNPAMLERGRSSAAALGVESHLEFVEADLNSWQPPRRYHAVMANQSLHHVVNLEGLFAAVRGSLETGGAFVVSDMIGRNGHRRWPEALAIVYEFWRELPPAYRFNRQLDRYEEMFLDWDSSAEGFEGVRAQDILPLLASQFHFRLFIPFGNVIDPFTDRSFGWNFDAACDRDRRFIDRVHERDCLEMSRGNVAPTHMKAVMTVDDPGSEGRWPGSLSPSFCIRDPERQVAEPHPPDEPFAWEKLAPWARREAAWWGRAHQALTAPGKWVLDLEAQLKKRTEWALELERERAAVAEHARRLEEMWLERSRWGIELEKELERVRAIARELQGDLAREQDRAIRAESELKQFRKNPLSYFAGKFLRRARATGYGWRA